MIDDPAGYFHALGGLHDARLLRIAMEFGLRTLIVDVDDLHAAFLDLPDDPGRRAAQLRFLDVAMLEMGIEPLVDHCRIFDLDVEASGDAFEATLGLAPRGRMRWRFSGVVVAGLPGTG